MEVAIALVASLLAGAAGWRVSVRSARRTQKSMAADLAQFEALALEDPLTGIANKRAFDERLEAELRRAARGDYPPALLALDLDRFKQPHDTRGPPPRGEGPLPPPPPLRAGGRAGGC